MSGSEIAKQKTAAGAASVDVIAHPSPEAHLQFIQSTIERMANNSFLVKGWAVTVSAGALAFAVQSDHPYVVLAGVFPTLTFWLMDAYYLKQERLYRSLYDAVRLGREESSFSMDAQRFADGARNNLWSTLRAPTIWWLHFLNLAVLSVTPPVMLYG